LLVGRKSSFCFVLFCLSWNCESLISHSIELYQILSNSIRFSLFVYIYIYIYIYIYAAMLLCPHLSFHYASLF
jgi:hypothetical protein